MSQQDSSCIQNHNRTELTDLENQIVELEKEIKSSQQTFDNIVAYDWAGDFSGAAERISDKLDTDRALLNALIERVKIIRSSNHRIVD